MGEWRRGKLYGFEIFSIASSALGVIYYFPGSRRSLSLCVCVAVPVDVQQLYDRPSCKFLPTQSDLSHKNTRIKTKIEAKRLKKVNYVNYENYVKRICFCEQRHLKAELSTSSYRR